MLRLIKKHLAACEKTSEKDFKCKPKSNGAVKPNCPFYIVGPDPRNPATRIKKHAGTSNEKTACAVLHDFERELYLEPDKKPPKSLGEAIADFIATKKHRSEDRRRKCQRILGRMAAFLDAPHVTQVTKVDLERFMQTWHGAYLTLKRDRELLKGFWKYVYDSDHTPKNIAVNLPTIGDDRQEKERRIPTFTPAEIEVIITALDRCEVIFEREGEQVARQVKAFTFVQRYTGLSIGDTAKLRRSEVIGETILLNRKKTGEPVATAVPAFVVAALKDMKPDSPEYYFWSGNGKLHTRTSKWGARLQKLFVFAGVRVVEVEKTKRSGGKLKDAPERVLVSKATPHIWRHTLVRDLYLKDTPVEDIADLLGDDVDTVREYYSSFDELRKKKLVGKLRKVWEDDPLTQRLAGAVHASGS